MFGTAYFHRLVEESRSKRARVSGDEVPEPDLTVRAHVVIEAERAHLARWSR